MELSEINLFLREELIENVDLQSKVTNKGTQ